MTCPSPVLARRLVLRAGLSGFAALLPSGCGRTSPHLAEHPTPAQAWARLAEGNRHWAEGRLRHPDQSEHRRRQVAAEQSPLATVVSCIDSRVPPETVFDQGVGDLFAVRTAAQTLDGLVTGSVEYGPLEKGTPLIVVLGHQRCGAVKAAVAALGAGGHPPPGRLGTVVAALRPAYEEAVREAARGAAGGDVADLTVRAQILRSARELAADPALAAAIRAGTLGIVGAYYDLGTGRVSVLTPGV
ncbi:carbonic anhydrase [Spirillospora sp. NPDC048911]|uniref:carbonic anhydrase n=1 Tax=Spirillospora sp. NPDC048911 TaxID=3364527 RepID=UPI0037244924